MVEKVKGIGAKAGKRIIKEAAERLLEEME